MTLLAPTLQAFFVERLMTQRQASPHTIAGYRDTMRLLLCFATEQTGKQPSKLEISDLDARLISAFLDHLEHERHNTASTRNVRLAAIRSLYRFAALRHPEHADTIARVLAIPAKRFDRALVNYLTTDEVKALLAAPDRSTPIGRRDHALMLTAIQTGLRVSELTGLRCQDVHLGTISYLFTLGKNRKQRTVPLTSQTVKVLTIWLKARHDEPTEPLFPSNRGARLSRDTVEWLINKHTTTAAKRCPSLGDKRVTAHVLRHTTAMTLLQSEISTSVIALWLGHEQEQTTRAYLHGDLRLKQQALDRTTPPTPNPAATEPATSCCASSTTSQIEPALCRIDQPP